MTIFGIGTDICDIRRIDQAFSKNGESFAKKILSEEERLIWHERFLQNRERGIRFLATRFCAKEAFSKAIGLGFQKPMTFAACEIQNHETGQPFVILHGDLKDWFDSKKLKSHISLSDENDYACAFVIIESL